MSENLRDFLNKRDQKKFATSAGTDAHTKMQRIVIDDNVEKGDLELINKIKSNTGLFAFFCAKSRTEVPIAGILNGKFVSRRIDRMVIDDTNKKITILDYKTDINKNTFRDKYVFQMKEYSELLGKIYPNYSIRTFVLWLHDFTLEEIS